MGTLVLWTTDPDDFCLTREDLKVRGIDEICLIGTEVRVSLYNKLLPLSVPIRMIDQTAKTSPAKALVEVFLLGEANALKKELIFFSDVEKAVVDFAKDNGLSVSIWIEEGPKKRAAKEKTTKSKKKDAPIKETLTAPAQEAPAAQAPEEKASAPKVSAPKASAQKTPKAPKESPLLKEEKKPEESVLVKRPSSKKEEPAPKRAASPVAEALKRAYEKKKLSGSAYTALLNPGNLALLESAAESVRSKWDSESDKQGALTFQLKLSFGSRLEKFTTPEKLAEALVEEMF
jgi:hypothetical protein